MVTARSAVAFIRAICGCLAAPFYVLSSLSQAAAAVAPADNPPAVASRVSVADLVRFASIGDPSREGRESAAKPGALSPDGRLVAVLVRRGNPEASTNDADLLVFTTADLLTNGRPQLVTTFASATNQQPISHLRWLGDSRTLVFAGAQGTSASQVYQVDLNDLNVRSLTAGSDPLTWYDITPSGDKLITISEAPFIRPEEDPTCMKRGCRVVAASLALAEQSIGADKPQANMAVRDLRNGQQFAMAMPESSDSDLEFCDHELAGGISPDGRFGLQICDLKPGHWPTWWMDYTVEPDLKGHLERGNNMYGRQAVLLDFVKRSSRRLSTAPWLYHQPAPIWIDGGRQLLLIGELEPLDEVRTSNRANGTSKRTIQSFNPLTGQMTRVAALDPGIVEVSSARWSEQTKTLTIESIGADKLPRQKISFSRKGPRWSPIPVIAADEGEMNLGNGVYLDIEQSPNERPVLVASTSSKVGSRRVVLDPNAWLADRAVGHVELIEGTSKNRLSWYGGLYYPPDYKPGVRYPLLVQTHGFDRAKFSLHGITRNFVAQAAAAQGIVVLQVAEVRASLGGPDEWPQVQAGYESAVDYLDRRGIIDSKRVGIIGWSRTGPHVGYTLTHSSYSFAAAALTSTVDYGWLWYLAEGAPPSQDAMYGASPFGAGLDLWQSFSPSFNLDKVTAPVLMWENSAVWGLWDWYAGLRRLGKPVEYWYLPDGEHDLFKVQERMHTNQLLVDWFVFWLRDEEDSDAGKVAQYERWRRFRLQSVGHAGQARSVLPSSR